MKMNAESAEVRRRLTIAARLTPERKRRLREKLAVMIDLAWRSAEFDPGESLTDDEFAYLEDRLEAITKRLVR